MQRPLAYDQSTVFAKTAKGREEIALRAQNLNVRQRSVLILVDGSKNYATIGAIMPLPDLPEIICYLMRQGLIGSPADDLRKVAHAEPRRAESATPHPALHVVSSVRSPAAQHPPAAAPASEQRLTVDPAKIRQVKDFMTITTQTYLGLLGADMIRRIEHAQDAAQLMAVLGHWHMALQDSKHGSRFAAPYLAQIKQSLAEEIPADPQQQSTANREMAAAKPLRAQLANLA